MLLSSHLVLHLIHVSWVWPLSTLLPFRFTWRVPSYLVLLLTTACRCSSNHIVLTMHTLSLGHHTTKASCVREHFVVHSHWVAIGPKVLSAYQVLLAFVLSMLRKTLVSILSLPFDIDWRLRSNSIFRWSRAWLLRVCSFILLHHLTIHGAWWNSSSHQIVVLLHEPKWVRRRSVVMHSIFLG